jgi:hypothetical protein
VSVTAESEGCFIVRESERVSGARLMQRPSRRVKAGDGSGALRLADLAINRIDTAHARRLGVL